jgi:NAD(P)-dependent dehydrogenase (short-subunit alcohol dehydrogenase family)
MPLPDYSAVPFDRLLDVSTRRVVITGGMRGLGFAIGRRFAEGGASVLLTDIDGEGARAAAAKLKHLRGRVAGMALDATRPAEHNAAARYAVDEFGGLDVWVNNAGIFPSHGILELTDDQWRHVVSINLDGVLYGCRAAGRAMRDTSDGGCIINMSSTAGYKATSVRRAHYIAAKHGVIGLTKSVALELAPYGIRSIGLAPTLTTTEGVADRMASRPGADAADRAEQLAAALPAGRVGHPDDVARVAVFCASPLAGFVTGVTIPVDGGDTATG